MRSFGIGLLLGILVGGFVLAGALAAPGNSPAIPATVTVTPGDTAAAKETCRRRHLSWSRLEVNVDSTKLGIVCESEDIVRQQVLQCGLVKRGDK